MNTPSKIDRIRHSLSHIMTVAVLEQQPKSGLGVGPAIENGFYQDYDLVHKISDEDLQGLEKRMKDLIRQNLEFKRVLLPKAEALKLHVHDPYKTELIEEFYPAADSEVQFYETGGILNLCKGGHVESTKEINPRAFKLVNVAGAYWRGDEKSSMLTRIYGVAFETEEELTTYLQRIKEAKERDHRKIGRELDLFTFSELIGPGLPLWTPKGTLIRHELDAFVWELRQARGYERVEIPHITKKDLYETSGHWDKFKEELFKVNTREDHIFAMKPMNCPHHTQIFARQKWSYRDMPQRYANTTMCYRDEQTGELHGLTRVRAFTQDDAHVFCRQSQIQQEANHVWDIIYSFYQAFGFELTVRLSLHDANNMSAYLGEEATWLAAEEQLHQVITTHKKDFREAVGEAAFYGPKIDFMATDSIGREWQVATIQLDMNLPERFDLSCVNEEGKDERIVMIHAAIMGSLERFLAIMLEHCNGNLPLWLAPVQIALLPVSDSFNEFAQRLSWEWKKQGLRVTVDSSSETLGTKIRRAAAQKVPYLIVIGQKEVDGAPLQIRVRGQEELATMHPEDFSALTKELIKKRSAELQ